MEYESTWWAIELPSGWLAEPEEDCVSIWSEEGVGALQISAYKRDHEPINDKDLYEFVGNELPRGVNPRNISCGEFTGLYIPYVQDNQYWQKWMICEGSTMLFVTYNCDPKDKVLEIQAVDKMLNTLKSR
jgi:hypothetical protein